MQFASRPVWRIDIEQVSGSYMSQIKQLSAAEQAESQRAGDAINAIPTGGKKDFEHLRPLDHAASLPLEAAPLRRIIETPAVKELVNERKTASRGANKMQGVARLLSNIFLIFAIVGAAIALLATITYLGLDDRHEAYLRYFIWLCFIVAGVVATLSTTASLFAAYKHTRNSAEQLRRDIFTKIISINDTALPDEISTILLQLEYFVRFQLDAQINYYATRISEQSPRTKWLSRLRSGATAIFVFLLFVVLLIGIGAASEQGHLTSAARLTGILNWLEAKSVDTWVITGLLGVTAIYVFMLLTALQFGDHRSLYGEALAGLIAIKDRELVAAREAAAKDDPEPMRKMAARVHEVMRHEHSIWLGA